MHPYGGRSRRLLPSLLILLTLASTGGASMASGAAAVAVAPTEDSPPVVDYSLPGTSCADALGVRCEGPSTSQTTQAARRLTSTGRRLSLASQIPRRPEPVSGRPARIALALFFGSAAGALWLALMLVSGRRGMRHVSRAAKWAMAGLEVVSVMGLVAAVVAAIFGTASADSVVAGTQRSMTAGTIEEVARSGRAVVATATGTTVHVFDRPSRSGVPLGRFDNPWRVAGDPAASQPLVFAVEGLSNGWVNASLPTRPNGATGWIRRAEVSLSETPYWISIELSTHRLTVFRDETIIARDTVAVGSARTPTPTGRFFVTALLQAPRPDTIYGPYAFALSGFSPTLKSFNGGDGELGIHGNNDPRALGNDVTHGCIRVSNAIIRSLVGVLPLGVPVEVV